MLKQEIRIVGFDDGSFSREDEEVVVIGAVFRGGKIIDGVLKTEVKVDGTDSTDKLIELINSSRHKPQLKVIMLDGITLGGFNVVDVEKLHKRTGLPVIVFNRKLPDLERVRNALKKFEDFEKRWRAVENAGKIKTCRIGSKQVFYQNIGIDDEEAEEVIRISCTRGLIPEPLRVAHLIATAISRGESHGRA